MERAWRTSSENLGLSTVILVEIEWQKAVKASLAQSCQRKSIHYFFLYFIMGKKNIDTEGKRNVYTQIKEKE